jgi:hypothetical protein
MAIVTQLELENKKDKDQKVIEEDSVLKQNPKIKKEKKENKSCSEWALYNSEYRDIPVFELYTKYGTTVECRYGVVDVTDTEVRKQLLSEGFVEEF